MIAEFIILAAAAISAVVMIATLLYRWVRKEDHDNDNREEYDNRPDEGKPLPLKPIYITEGRKGLSEKPPKHPEFSEKSHPPTKKK